MKNSEVNKSSGYATVTVDMIGLPHLNVCESLDKAWGEVYNGAVGVYFYIINMYAENTKFQSFFDGKGEES